MSFFTRMLQRRQNALQTDTNANKPDAYVGANVEGVYTILGSNGPAWIWVTLDKGGPFGPPKQVINRNVSPMPDLPVKLGVNSMGQPYAMDIAEGAIDAYMSGNSGGSSISGRVAPHSHELGFGLYDPVHSLRIWEGKVWWRSVDGDVVVYINGFFYFDNSGAEQYFASQPFNLSTYLTVTAGQHQWVKVGVNPSTGLPVAAVSTPVNVVVPLAAADLAAISLSARPLAGVQITFGQAISGDGDFVDLRFQSGAPTGTGGSFYQTVQGNGSVATQQPIIDFIDGTNTTVTVTNDGAGTRTKVKIDATGGGSDDGLYVAWSNL